MYAVLLQQSFTTINYTICPYRYVCSLLLTRGAASSPGCLGGSVY